MCPVSELEISTGSSDFASTFKLPSDSAAENAADLTVKNLIGMDEGALTVAIAFPAYMGRVNVVLLDEESCSREVMSDTAGMSSLAATRGRIDFADEECADTTCVKGEFSERSFSRSGERVSAIGVVYCEDVECRIEVRPFSLASHDQCSDQQICMCREIRHTSLPYQQFLALHLDLQQSGL
jgi:hypothetical protein